MSAPFLSEIRMFSFDFPPRGWAKCDGQLLSIAQNQALFALLGTTFGGNGVQTFALPDLRSRVPVHTGASPGTSNRVLGERGGEEGHTLTLGELPQHTHQVYAAGAPTTGDPTNALLATPTTSKPYRSGVGNTALPNLGPSGGNLPHPNLQPYLTVNFAIALQGLFPSRS